ncbi:MAG: site-specific DNA-methyltransferase [Mycoplasma sp.]|nr:site-specific DNA-methyltransferase [Mycoplasma sp.]
MEKNKIYLLDVNDFLSQIKNNSIDLIIADPPYNIGVDEWDIFKSQKEYWDFMFRWINKSIDKLKKGGSIYIFNNQFNSAIILNYLVKKGLNFNNWITWYKKDGFHPTKSKFVNNQETILFFSKGKPKTFNFDDVRIPYLSKERISSPKGMKGKNGKVWFPNPNGKLCPDVWDMVSERHKLKKNGRTVKLSHPTTKPTLMIERMIQASSNEGDTILDLFAGSGQTSVLSKKMKRNFLACEINKKYFNTCLERLKNE